MNIKNILNHPLVNKACFRFSWLGKLMCKLDLNHSYRLTGVHTDPFKLTARCIYCGKEDEFKAINHDKPKEK